MNKEEYGILAMMCFMLLLVFSIIGIVNTSYNVQLIPNYEAYFPINIYCNSFEESEIEMEIIFHYGTKNKTITGKDICEELKRDAIELRFDFCVENCMCNPDEIDDCDKWIRENAIMESDLQ